MLSRKSFAYAISWLLIKLAPEGGSRADCGREYTEENCPPPVFRPHGDRMARFAVARYKRSRIRKRFLAEGKSVCRFIPSCSDYCLRAVHKYGIYRGLMLTGARLRRCNPSYQGDSIDFP
jgi:putative component of membrane protein insertase Oxa1/YidC/SpoIIIJ protein YidD